VNSSKETSGPFLPHTTMIAYKDVQHLFRLATVFVLGLIMFLVLRAVLVPKSFGQFGHYRGDALQEIAAKPIAFAGHEVCEACHTDVLDIKKHGRHARVACESCHGPLANHVEDPGTVKPAKLDTALLCVRCHESIPAKPMDFPQVNSAEHSAGLPCETCHQPHSPRIETEEKKK